MLICCKYPAGKSWKHQLDIPVKIFKKFFFCSNEDTFMFWLLCGIPNELIMHTYIYYMNLKSVPNCSQQRRILSQTSTYLNTLERQSGKTTTETVKFISAVKILYQ